MHARALPCLLLLLGTGSAVAAEPVLNMHIYDAPEQTPEVIDAPQSLPKLAAHSNLEMVVFSDDAPVDTGKSAPIYLDTSNEFVFTYDFGGGYEQDQFEWNVAAPTGSPDPLTEAKWQDLQMGRINGGFNIATPNNLVFKGAVSYAWTVDGDSQEISYLGEGGQKPFSNVQGSTDQGYAWNALLGIGYQFDLKFGSQSGNSLKLTPLVGYAWQKQELRMQNGRQQITGYGANSVSDAQNIYVADWQGPWLGLDAQLTLFNKHQLFSSFEYHWDDYTGRGNWQRASNLQHPESFVHQANGTGWLAKAGYRYRLNKQLGLQMAFDYQKWTARSGQEQLFISDKSSVNSTLNSVSRESMGVNLGINFDF